MKKAYIVLENGQSFEGYAFGAEGEALGELVFTTGMGGYIETLTDPSYFGQIVIQTFPLIGNYGMIKEDMESKKSYVNGYVVRECCGVPSNFRCEEPLDAFLKAQGIVGICGVDTRELTKIIRETGVMNARIVTELAPNSAEDLKNYRIMKAVETVSCEQPEEYYPEGETKCNVVLIDYGAKMNICRELVKRGCHVTCVPYSTTAEEILAMNPDGVMLSNGPGDPSDNMGCIAELQKLVGKVPMFGICLGHQLLALANGGKTEKLKYGHRGVNQPVKDLQTGRVYITSQNHGYAVVAGSLAKDKAVLRYINANDGTCEGIDYPALRAYSVQFHPEACSGPLDSRFLFERFITMMGDESKCR